MKVCNDLKRQNSDLDTLRYTLSDSQGSRRTPEAIRMDNDQIKRVEYFEPTEHQ